MQFNTSIHRMSTCRPGGAHRPHGPHSASLERTHPTGRETPGREPTESGQQRALDVLSVTDLHSCHCTYMDLHFMLELLASRFQRRKLTLAEVSPCLLMIVMPLVMMMRRRVRRTGMTRTEKRRKRQVEPSWRRCREDRGRWW